jgi:hypothetical protein
MITPDFSTGTIPAGWRQFDGAISPDSWNNTRPLLQGRKGMVFGKDIPNVGPGVFIPFGKTQKRTFMRWEMCISQFPTTNTEILDFYGYKVGKAQLRDGDEIFDLRFETNAQMQIDWPMGAGDDAKPASTANEPANKPPVGKFFTMWLDLVIEDYWKNRGTMAWSLGGVRPPVGSGSAVELVAKNGFQGIPHQVLFGPWQSGEVAITNLIISEEPIVDSQTPTTIDSRELVLSDASQAVGKFIPGTPEEILGSLFIRSLKIP